MLSRARARLSFPVGPGRTPPPPLPPAGPWAPASGGRCHCQRGHGHFPPEAGAAALARGQLRLPRRPGRFRHWQRASLALSCARLRAVHGRPRPALRLGAALALSVVTPDRPRQRRPPSLRPAAASALNEVHCDDAACGCSLRPLRKGPSSWEARYSHILSDHRERKLLVGVSESDRTFSPRRRRREALSVPMLQVQTAGMPACLSTVTHHWQNLHTSRCSIRRAKRRSDSDINVPNIRKRS